MSGDTTYILGSIVIFSIFMIYARQKKDQAARDLAVVARHREILSALERLKPPSS